jgi:uncharacterized protein (TIGR04141 family)
MAQKTFTLHLAKPDVINFLDVFSPSAHERIDASGAHVIEDESFADGACLFVFVAPANAPKWLGDLRQRFAVPTKIETKSACAVLVFKSAARMFAVTFAHGWMYLDEDNFEGDFGLRAALNALDDKKLKRLERANLADALRGVSLSPFQREFASFGLDDALDLVRKVSGATKEEASADSMTGARSLKLVGDFSIEDLLSIAAEALNYFNSVAYKSTSFQIIDVVTPIPDRRQIAVLDNLAAESIRQGRDNFELGLPANYEDDGVAFRFSGPRLRRRYPDLLLRNYTSALGDKLTDLTVETLRDHKIIAVFEDGVKPEQKWSIRKALVGSILHEGGQYAANEGEWYRIDETFKESIEAGYRGLVRDWSVPPVPLAKIYDLDGNGTYQSEASYNAERAAALGYVLLDTKSVQIPGIARSGFEPCDLLDLNNKRFIHIKKNSRRSNILSHLFKQGSNAAQNFKRFPGAWDALVALIRHETGDEAAERLATAMTGVQAWTVEFWIADAPRIAGGFNIPFFSKISLRDETSHLAAMGYGVAIRFIGLEPDDI